MLALRHARQRGQGLALGAGDHQHHLVVAQASGLLHLHQGARRDAQVAQLARQVHVAHQALARGGHLAPAGRGQVEDLLQALDVAGEQRDDDAAPRLVEDLAQAGHDLALGQGEALALHIGGVGQKQLDPGFGKAADGVHVRGVAVHGVAVDLEVAGVQHAAHGGFDAQRVALDDGVADRDEVEGERADLHAVAGLHRPQVGVDAVLLELGGHQGQGEVRAVHRHVDVRQQPRQRADVVLVPVGQHHGLQFVLLGQDVLEARNDHVHAEEIVLREHEPAVHQHGCAPGLEGHAVEPDLPQAA